MIQLTRPVNRCHTCFQ